MRISIRLDKNLYYDLQKLKDKLETICPWKLTVSDVIRLCIKEALTKYL